MGNAKNNTLIFSSFSEYIKMIGKIKIAFDKLFFCWNVSRNISSFLTLILNTKKYRWSKKRLSKSIKNIHQPSEKYSLRFDHKPHDIYLRTYSGDIDIFYEIFWKQVYKFNYLGQPDMIIDLGANIGLAALFFTIQFPQSKIVCVEPEPGNLEILKKNLAVQISNKKVTVVETAISLQDGYTTLHIPGLKYNPTIKNTSSKAIEEIDVKVMSMQSLLHTNNIQHASVLKIDVEGSEEEIFSCNTDWLSIIKEIIIETHSVKAEEICSKALEQKQFALQHKSGFISHWVRN